MASNSKCLRPFGTLPDGGAVQIVTLGSPDGLQAEILTLGGTLRSLTLPVGGRRLQLVLSPGDLGAYLQDRMYIGQLVGRYANRISGAQFALDGATYRLTANEGENALHGGDVGFGKFLWSVLDVVDPREQLLLHHRSPAGINGFPGNLEVVASISVRGNTLALHFEATADAPTPISFTWHPYFNLSGDPGTPIAGHRLRLAAARYLPVHPSWLPTGEIARVDGTRFDFRTLKSLRAPADRPFNHYWISDDPTALVGELVSPESGVRMEIRTDLPGMQVYDGFALGEQYPGVHALSIEPGNYPNAPNHANFPSSVLRPGETHRSSMSFSFS